MAGLIQNEDIKSESELTAAGGAASQLPNDTKIWLSTLGKRLDTAITDNSLSGGGLTTVTKTANYTASSTDDVILCNTNAFTITLRAATVNRAIRIIKIGPDANAITISAGGADTINGVTSSVILLKQRDELYLIPDGTSNWFIAQFKRSPKLSMLITSGTFTPTFGAKALEVILIGAGGGGGGSGTGGDTNGGAGGTTYFDSVAYYAFGGNGGNAATAGAGAGGTGASGGVGDVVIGGAFGSNSPNVNGLSGAVGGDGASTTISGGGIGGRTPFVGGNTPVPNTGTGGGGAGGSSTQNGAGGGGAGGWTFKTLSPVNASYVFTIGAGGSAGTGSGGASSNGAPGSDGVIFVKEIFD